LGEAIEIALRFPQRAFQLRQGLGDEGEMLEYQQSDFELLITTCILIYNFFTSPATN
jgi:hypothetical protein